MSSIEGAASGGQECAGEPRGGRRLLVGGGRFAPHRGGTTEEDEEQTKRNPQMIVRGKAARHIAGGYGDSWKGHRPKSCYLFIGDKGRGVTTFGQQLLIEGRALRDDHAIRGPLGQVVPAGPDLRRPDSEKCRDYGGRTSWRLRPQAICSVSLT